MIITRNGKFYCVNNLDEDMKPSKPFSTIKEAREYEKSIASKSDHRLGKLLCMVLDVPKDKLGELEDFLVELLGIDGSKSKAPETDLQAAGS